MEIMREDASSPIRSSFDFDEAKHLMASGKDVFDDDFQKDRARTDVERQTVAPQHESDIRASGSKVAAFLALYFLFNIGLTLYNKQVLGSFPFPWILTAVHTGSAGLGSWVVLKLGWFELTPLSMREHGVLFMFSLLFTINIALSNVSLGMVSIPFHQIMRATCPVFTILIYRIFFDRTYAGEVYAAIASIIAGVALATFGEYAFSFLGFVLTIIGVMLAAIKGIITNRLMTGRLRLVVFGLLLRMGPLAAVQSLAYSMMTGEFAQFFLYARQGEFGLARIVQVVGNGAIAFGLNVVSFQTNKLAGALSITICANLKQCLTITLGAFLWSIPVSLLNGAGILLAIAGAAWYSCIELKNKKATG